MRGSSKLVLDEADWSIYDALVKKMYLIAGVGAADAVEQVAHERVVLLRAVFCQGIVDKLCRYMSYVSTNLQS